MASQINRRAVVCGLSAGFVAGATSHSITAQQPNPVGPRGHVQFDETNQSPKAGVTCEVVDGLQSKVTGVYHPGSGSFDFAQLPAGQGPLTVRVNFNGRLAESLELSRGRPSMLEIRFPDPNAPNPNKQRRLFFSTPSEVLRWLISVAVIAMEARRNERELANFTKSEQYSKFMAIIEQISGEMDEIGAAQALTTNESRLCRTTLFEVRNLLLGFEKDRLEK
jgi:hypothetical protein